MEEEEKNTDYETEEDYDGSKDQSDRFADDMEEYRS